LDEKRNEKTEQKSEPKRRVGPFELERKLGVGGMGVVYLATYLKNGRKMAVKVLAPEMSADGRLLRRFLRRFLRLLDLLLRRGWCRHRLGHGWRGDGRDFRLWLHRSANVAFLRERHEVDGHHGSRLIGDIERVGNREQGRHNDAAVQRERTRPCRRRSSVARERCLGDPSPCACRYHCEALQCR